MCTNHQFATTPRRYPDNLHTTHVLWWASACVSSTVRRRRKKSTSCLYGSLSTAVANFIINHNDAPHLTLLISSPSRGVSHSPRRDRDCGTSVFKIISLRKLKKSELVIILGPIMGTAENNNSHSVTSMKYRNSIRKYIFF